MISQLLAVPGRARSCSCLAFSWVVAGVDFLHHAIRQLVEAQGAGFGCWPEDVTEIPALGQHAGDLARIQLLACRPRRRLVDGDEAGEAGDQVEVERGLEHALVDVLHAHAGVTALLEPCDLRAGPELGDARGLGGIGQREGLAPCLAVELARERRDRPSGLWRASTTVTGSPE